MSAKNDAKPESTVTAQTAANKPGTGNSSKASPAARDLNLNLNLDLGLDIGIGIWEGTAVFSSEPKKIRSKPQRAMSKGTTRTVPSTVESPPETPKPHRLTQAQEPSGSACSPISVASSTSSSPSSSPVPLPRPRAVPSYTSPLPRTAFTPPRDVHPAQPPIPPAAANPLPRTASQSTSFRTQASKPIHPFFTRTRSVPPPSQPRYVAHYSSTEASQSQTTESQSTTSASQSASQSSFGKSQTTPPQRQSSALDELAEAVGRLDMEARPWGDRRPLTKSPDSNTAGNGNGKGKGKEQNSGDRTSAPSTSRDKIVVARPTVTQIQPNYGRRVQQANLKTYSGPSAGDAPPSPVLPYFHYSAYPSPPQVVYTSHAEEANDLLSCLKGNILGFDLEWPPAGEYTVSIPGGGTMKKKIGMTWDESRKKYIFGQGRTALMQFCDEKLVVLIHLGENMDIPSKAIELIRDPKIYKLGVQVKGDGQKLLRDFPNHFALPLPPVDPALRDATATERSASVISSSHNVGPAGLLELSYLARAVDPIGTGPGTTLISLANLTKSYLGKQLAKPAKVRRGNWFEALDQEARDYAANDVYAAVQIYNTLMDFAKEQDFSPNLDLYCFQVGSSTSIANTARDSGSTQPAKQFFSAGPAEVRIGAKTFPLPQGALKAPPPAHLSALENFMDRMDVQMMADIKGVKTTTIEGYICQALEVLGIDILEQDDRKRLWTQIPRGSYTWKKSRKTYRALRSEFGQGDEEDSESSGSSR
ncbi:hypothetical protein IAU59_006115 [Kwoniella sp. CBS 9459]